MVELKPCPACGSKIASPTLEYDVEFPQLGYVRCREITCGLKTGLFADGGRHAVEIWNSLPRPDEVRGVGKWDRVETEFGLRCPKCGKLLDEYVNGGEWVALSEIPNYCPNCGAKMEPPKEETE